MQKITYLQECLRNDKIIRWPDGCMPLKVYIAPMNFYSKKGESYLYKSMVQKAFCAWEEISGGLVSFELVDVKLNSQIDVDWKRVDRSALGHCYFNFDANNRLYSAEVQIGLTDGLIHQEYLQEDEVYHTILHEIGHSIGLNHSPNTADIMYTPHQYGVTNLSLGDKETLKWLYRFPLNATPREIANEYGFQTDNIDEIVAKLIERKEPSKFEKVKKSLSMQPNKNLLDEQTNIADLKKYNLSLQNIRIPQKLVDTLVHTPKKPKN